MNAEQVYECMVRGIAVMRRRADSYVNATQILKVAGVDKGRRTKILEKEILPGKHEIVQGGYGKYQGTWCVSRHLAHFVAFKTVHCRIPLERGRDIAVQYGVASLLAPLFDFVPNTNAIGALPPGLPPMAGEMCFRLLLDVPCSVHAQDSLPLAWHLHQSCLALHFAFSIKDALKVSSHLQRQR